MTRPFRPGASVPARGAAAARGRAFAALVVLACVLLAAAPRARANATPGAAPAAPHHAAKPGAGAKPATTPAEDALAIRTLEELGGYGQAADALQALRRRVSADADLDLWWAIDLARSGEADSAARILASPLLEAALRDTADSRRFRIYGWRHEGVFLDGHFSGWYWYVARARAEVYASLGRWADALEAARVCTRARPLSGVEWYLRALCAARVGERDEADDAAVRAQRLAPIVPETRYLVGVLDWRAGRRVPAQEEFRAAIDLDSTYRAPALALVRARLPVPPDSLPARLFHGLREASLLTSGVAPKYDDFEQLDGPATIARADTVAIPDSLAGRVRPFTAHPIVLVDPQGRVAFHEDAWARAGSIPEDLVGLISSSLRRWRFQPATRSGRPAALWVDLEVQVGS